MIRNNLISVVFKTVPEGTNYRTDGWTWVNIDKGRNWIEQGFCREWKPDVKQSSIPTMSNTKKEITQYLESNGIKYDEYSTKAELIELI